MKCKIFSVLDIKNDEKIVENMFLLMKNHYENMKKDKFLKDLYDKNNVFLLFENNELKGFSTIKKMELNIENEKDTVNGKIVGFFFWGYNYRKGIFLGNRISEGMDKILPSGKWKKYEKWGKNLLVSDF